VFKGVRMAGRHGGVKTTTLNLVVHSVDADKGVILIKGAIPGPTGSLVLVRSAAKAPATRGANTTQGGAA
jgi:large subunit ribosomal protein L3